MTAGTRREQLERRAAELARRPTRVKPVATVEVVTVVTCSRRFALEVRHVARILRTHQLCRLPEGGSQLVGVVMAGGEAVPVVDLASVLLQRLPDRTRPMVVLLGGGDSPLGLLVDEVESFGEVVEMASSWTPAATDQVEPDPALLVERGVTADGVVLLDAEALLAHPDAVAERPLRPPAPHRAPPRTPTPRSQENP